MALGEFVRIRDWIPQTPGSMPFRPPPNIWPQGHEYVPLLPHGKHVAYMSFCRYPCRITKGKPAHLPVRRFRFSISVLDMCITAQFHADMECAQRRLWVVRQHPGICDIQDRYIRLCCGKEVHFTINTGCSSSSLQRRSVHQC